MIYEKKPLIERECIYCGQIYRQKHHNDRYCSLMCRDNGYNFNVEHWKLNNIDKIKEEHKKYYLKNKDRFITHYKNKTHHKHCIICDGQFDTIFPNEICCSKECSKKRNKHLERINKKRYYELNKSIIKIYRTSKASKILRKKSEEKRLQNPTYRLKQIIKSGLRSVLKRQNATKNNRTLKYIGCSLPELKEHIENQFKKGMTWKNYGTVWQVDHRIPLSWFNHKIEEEIYKAWNFNNLQPLDKKENNHKKNSYSEPTLKQMGFV